MVQTLQPQLVIADRFRLEACLASGGYGDVWRAYDLQSESKVAVKLLRNDAADKDPTAIARMRQEAEMLQTIEHPGVVEVIGYFETDYGEMIAMELLVGMALDQVLQVHGTASHEDAAAAVRQVLPALEVCHHHGIVHRDIKPENLVRVRTDDSQSIKLVDFGIAKATSLLSDSDTGVTLVRTRAGGFMGTPKYAAPEQVSGDPFGPSIDLYAFGLVIAEWLTGVPRIDGSTHGEVMEQVLNVAPIDVSDCPYRWREWLSRMIARNPNDRIQTAADALELFEELVVRLHEPAPDIVHGFTGREQIATPPQTFGDSDLVPDFARVEAAERRLDTYFRTEEELSSGQLVFYGFVLLVSIIVGSVILYLVL